MDLEAQWSDFYTLYSVLYIWQGLHYNLYCMHFIINLHDLTTGALKSLYHAQIWKVGKIAM